MDTHPPGAAMKKPWKPFRISRVGHVSELVLTGGGKGSPAPGDPGEARKPPGNPKSEQK